MSTTQFQVGNMSCEGCVRSMRRALQAIDADAQLDADIPAQTIQISTKADSATVLKALHDAGYEAKALS